MTNEFIRLAFVGDIMPGDSFFNTGGGLRRPLRCGMDPFERVKPLLQGHDLVFGNLECVLSSAGERPWLVSSAVMRGDPPFACRLKDAGFNVLNIANNHILQHGSACFKETLAVLEEQGISVVGSIGGDDGASLPIVLFGKTRIGMLGYSCRPERFYRGSLLYAFGTKERLIRDIASLRERCDILIVSLHWGDEFVHHPSEDQINLSHQMIDQGADIIIGHHSHTYQGIEVYRKRLIVYSLGNFLFDSYSSLTRTGMILSVKANPHESGFTYDIIPVSADERYFPRPLEGSNLRSVLSHVNCLSNGLNNADTLPVAGKAQIEAGLETVRSAERIHFFRYVLKHPWYAIQDVAGFIARRLLKPKAYIHPDTIHNY